MNTRVWTVEFSTRRTFGGFDTFTTKEVVANNVGEAIRKAISARKGEYCNRIQDVTKVELMVEADVE